MLRARTVPASISFIGDLPEDHSGIPMATSAYDDGWWWTIHAKNDVCETKTLPSISGWFKNLASQVIIM
jgi:hypothetical protein